MLSFVNALRAIYGQSLWREYMLAYIRTHSNIADQFTKICI
jgi:hypothetical protein